VGPELLAGVAAEAELVLGGALPASGSQWSMMPTIVRSLGYDLLPAASRAAELPTQII